MLKNKIIAFGSLPIATKVVMWIKEQHNLELVGVVINDAKEDLCNERKLLCKVKAFDFPGYEPAYMMIDGKNLYENFNIEKIGDQYGRRVI